MKKSGMSEKNQGEFYHLVMLPLNSYSKSAGIKNLFKNLLRNCDTIETNWKIGDNSQRLSSQIECVVACLENRKNRRLFRNRKTIKKPSVLQ